MQRVQVYQGAPDARRRQQAVADVLRRDDQEEQKTKSLFERKRRRMSLREDFSVPWTKKTALIFVDDVVTTGETAHAAYRALEQPKNFEILSLCYRPKLAERP